MFTKNVEKIFLFLLLMLCTNIFCPDRLNCQSNDSDHVSAENSLSKFADGDASGNNHFLENTKLSTVIKTSHSSRCLYGFIHRLISLKFLSRKHSNRCNRKIINLSIDKNENIKNESTDDHEKSSDHFIQRLIG